MRKAGAFAGLREGQPGVLQSGLLPVMQVPGPAPERSPHHKRRHEAAATQCPIQITGSRIGGRSTKREGEMLREHQEGLDTFQRAFIACMDARNSVR
jgi:hypothetical protein